ncbi:hypothetical protein A9B99_17790 [Mangrovibacter phragmitis]|uniref:Membrane-anchored protein n=1 Tax=Mangrovibacter phragmitis TaxID=1691903 RepID=A0A1B7KYA2_9ENTR|nr:hypothetical protein [Mangrovibacter phragmitis]OAT75028.1 hypothetical protein A9B99_17790 [Mangrovibacter phragmitis]
MEQANANLPVTYRNKVPEVTLVFWIIKMMSTTVGETAADFLNVNLHWGLTNTSLFIGALFFIALFIQVKSPKYVPVKYWTTVLLISVFGTLVTDNLTDHFGVPLILSTGVFTFLLVGFFAIWYRKERTLSIHSINTQRRELFYWTAILLTFSLGTAGGDWVSETLQLGFLNATLLFGFLITFCLIAYSFFKCNSVICFWIAYILTRPLGASLGDFLSQPVTSGGMNIGSTTINLCFLTIILVLVTYLHLAKKPASNDEI